jgi:hypothetical protein
MHKILAMTLASFFLAHEGNSSSYQVNGKKVRQFGCLKKTRYIIKYDSINRNTELSYILYVGSNFCSKR